MKDRFDFKQFSVRQDRCAMKVGTDGVLLGAWAGEYCLVQPTTHIRTAERSKQLNVLDIGTGTGIVALMLAQRMAESQIEFEIDAVEIDAIAAVQARENFDASPWGNRIRVFDKSLQAASECLETRRYDIIVSNPPFYNATLKPEDEGRAVARHKDALPVADIAHFAKGHLSEDGRLALIYPSDYDTEVMTAAVLNGLNATRICNVLTKAGKPCKRRMIVLSPHAATPQTGTLAIRNEIGKYTGEYLKLTQDFYLHLTD